MSRMLLNLFQVPEDEATDVRDMLDEHDIRWYETKPNRWGFSHGGIWVAEKRQFAAARKLMDAYQHERRERVRADHRIAVGSGEAPSLLRVVRTQPRTVVLTLLSVLLALALLALPVWLLSH